MKILAKILGGLLLLIILIVCGTLIYVSTVLPNVEPAPNLTIELTPERIERGEFLAKNVYVCMDCHSERDYSRFGLVITESALGKGGNLFGLEQGFPGDYYAANLTPYHLESWTDGEIFRAITTGVNKDGNALFPIMPYTNYRRIDKEDIYDIIAYLRTLEPIEHEVPASSSPFPMNFIINTIPTEPEFIEKPDISDRIAYGKYLTIAGSCADCHSPIDDRGAPLPGMTYAGGMDFNIPTGGIVYSANITPHKTTGIGAWTEEMFIARFKQFQDSTNLINQNLVDAGSFQTEMPWRFYSKMSEEELGAIFAYLQTLEPVEHTMSRFVAEAE
ncbi:MAG: c-type cytochrome [Balneolaceae bacterium]